MYKKTKILTSVFLSVSVMIAFSFNNDKKSEVLANNDKSTRVEANNSSLLANPNSSSSSDITDGYYKIAENENLELYVNNSNLGLKIKNKTTGYVWSSTLDTRDKILNQTWQDFAQSAVTIEYMDDTNKVRQISMLTEKVKTNVTKTDTGFKSDIYFDNEGIKLTLNVALGKDNISLNIPYSSIEEKNNSYKIQTVTLYPFLGASKGNNMSGYMFVPDGSGALISLSQKTSAEQPFIGRVYGDDLGVKGIPVRDKNDNSKNPEQIYMPVFGMNQNNTNGYVALIDGGAPYSEIEAYPAGVTTAFNWIAAKFVYRDSYLQPIDKKGDAITVNQKDKNSFDASIKYMFLSNENSSYVGMAKRYQQELINQGILKKKNTQTNKDVPVRLEFYAADNKKVFLWRSVVPMTTVQQMDSIVKDLRSSNVNSMSVDVLGWTKGGVTGSSPIPFPFEKKVGSAKDWQSFIAENESKGTPVYMYADFAGAYSNAGGYKKNDIAQTISEQLMGDSEYSYLNPRSVSRIFNSQIPKFNNYGINNIALESLGKNLNSAYNSNNAISRDDTIKTYEKMLSANNKNKYAFYSPNQYLWKYISELLDVPMDSSNFLLENEAVPFMQIALKGYVDYYAPASNFYSNSTNETLKLIDYGAFPSFDLTYEDPVKLIDTQTSWLYTSQYSVWKDEIVKTYNEVNKALNDVKNADLVNREQLQDGVYKDTYSNGVSIIINYSNEAYKYNDTTVDAQSYAVIGGTK